MDKEDMAPSGGGNFFASSFAFLKFNFVRTSVRHARHLGLETHRRPPNINVT